MASKRAFFSISRTAAGLSAAQARAPTSRSLLRPRRQLPVPVPLPCTTVRHAHSIPRPRNPSPFKQQPASSTSPSPPSAQQTQPTQQQATQPTNSKQPPNVRQQPHYELTFTCRPCGERSRHVVSKQGYHYGSVLIACPGCRNRHVISDHLRIFGETAMTVEDILRERGELVKRGTLLGEDQDLEFWEDGTTTVREPWQPSKGQDGVVKDDDDGAPPGASFQSVKPTPEPGERKEDS
ncbi:DNL zinc finger-domain-containing protein [Achaetomium macrosporum]|uniref:DNL zinc finger-domain-containing protein n=1 Tax=Achaetomium macrosporum TaxID=79813 RepID=A0AAN7HDI9_9PEZI|nr:DNL zinc finger-domain-containing protein [Achaetomium macrosporum]